VARLHSKDPFQRANKHARILAWTVLHWCFVAYYAFSLGAYAYETARGHQAVPPALPFKIPWT
jgi:hypothetical protein